MHTHDMGFNNAAHQQLHTAKEHTKENTQAQLGTSPAAYNQMTATTQRHETKVLRQEICNDANNRWLVAHGIQREMRGRSHCRYIRPCASIMQALVPLTHKQQVALVIPSRGLYNMRVSWPVGVMFFTTCSGSSTNRSSCINSASQTKTQIPLVQIFEPGPRMQTNTLHALTSSEYESQPCSAMCDHLMSDSLLV